MIRLITSADSGRLLVLPQFLAHYAALGVDSFHVVINTPDKAAADELVALFEAASSDYDAACSLLLEEYTTRAMWAMLNDIRSAAQGVADWIVWADSDEYQDYPEPLPEYLSGAGKWNLPFRAGVLVDRFADSGELRSARTGTPMSEQFPYGNLFSQHQLRATVDKVVLARPDVRLTDGNHYWADGREWLPAHAKIPVHHYKWTADAAKRLAARTTATWQAKFPWWRQSQRALDLMRAEGSAQRIACGELHHLHGNRAAAVDLIASQYIQEPEINLVPDLP